MWTKIKSSKLCLLMSAKNIYRSDCVRNQSPRRTGTIGASWVESREVIMILFGKRRMIFLFFQKGDTLWSVSWRRSIGVVTSTSIPTTYLVLQLGREWLTYPQNPTVLDPNHWQLSHCASEEKKNSTTSIWTICLMGVQENPWAILSFQLPWVNVPGS